MFARGLVLGGFPPVSDEALAQVKMLLGASFFRVARFFVLLERLRVPLGNAGEWWRLQSWRT